MTGRTLFWMCGIAFGLWLTFHCPRAAIREFRSGVAIGRYGEYPRDTKPLHFWTTIAVTFLAGPLGVLFMVMAVGAIATGQDNLAKVLEWWEATLIEPGGKL